MDFCDFLAKIRPKKFKIRVQRFKKRKNPGKSENQIFPIFLLEGCPIFPLEGCPFCGDGIELGIIGGRAAPACTATSVEGGGSVCTATCAA